MEDISIIIGEDQESIEWWQMCIRAIAVFIITLIMVRIAPTRVFGKNTAFDIVLGIILGSILSRAITGNSPFFQTIMAGFILVLLHMSLAYLSFNSRWGWLIKGKKKCLVRKGEYQKHNMKISHVTENDILEAARAKGAVSVKEIKEAYLERSGEISIILDSNESEE